MPGRIGTCSFVSAGMNPQPSNGCPVGDLCDGLGNCTGSCATDGDCSGLFECDGNRCAPCLATCVTDLECAAGAVCVHRNACTSCEPRDAGTTGG